jgi:hypothetical protein
MAEKEAEEAAFWAGLEHVASEAPEPPEPVPPPMYIINEEEEGCSGTNACAALFGGLIGKIERGLNKIGKVAVGGGEAIVSGAKYLGEAEIRGAERVYNFVAKHVSVHASPQDIACGVSAVSLSALPFATSNPFALTFVGAAGAVSGVVCAFTTVH